MPAGNKRRGRGTGGRNPPVTQGTQSQQAAYDGPPESPSRGRAGSTTGGPARTSSRAGSQPRTTSQTRAASQTRRVDPARDPPPAPVLLRNVDFGGQAYDLFSTVSEGLFAIKSTLSTIFQSSQRLHFSGSEKIICTEAFAYE